MITNETTKNLNLKKHPFGLGNGEYYRNPLAYFNDKETNTEKQQKNE
jgi:hypothetical protein